MLIHLESHSMLTINQHGFVKKRSCLTNFLETLESWTKTLHEGTCLDVLYLDYQKSFDTVPHIRLLAKSKWYSIEGNLLQWIEDFLTNRKMKVTVNDASSDWAEVYSGVPINQHGFEKKRSCLTNFSFGSAAVCHLCKRHTFSISQQNQTVYR